MADVNRGVEAIAFDGDDTLWHSEDGFEEATGLLREVLGSYVEPERVEEELYRTEAANMPALGYGAKAFTLSMVETAVRITDGRVTAVELQRILDAGKALLTRPVELIDGAAETVTELSRSYRLLLVTKGDLVHQERKVVESGLGDHFDRVEIVSEKEPSTYAQLLASESLAPEAFLMVGNSLRSDVLPVVEIGGRAAHVPYTTTWVHERVSGGVPAGVPTLRSLAELPGLVEAPELAWPAATDRPA